MKRSYLAIIFTAALGCSVLPATAQNMISSTNQVVMNSMVNSAVDSGNSRPKPNPVLYRERVPGKPEEGFVPVTTATSSRFTTTTVAVRDYGSVAVLSDNTKNVTCYILDPIGTANNTISCVSNK